MITGGREASNHDIRHTIRSVSLGAVWRALRYPFILLSALVIPRVMGDRVYGQYAFFMTVYFMLDVFSDVGITQTFGRFLPELREPFKPRATQLLHGMLFYGLLLTLAVIALAIIPLRLADTSAFKPSWWAILVLLLLITKLEGTLFAFLYGLNQIARFSLKQLLRSFTSFAFVLLLYLRFGLDGALWALVLGELLLLVVALPWVRGYLFAPFRPPRFADFKVYLFFGFRFFLPALLFGLLQRAGNLLIKSLNGSFEAIGYFDVANQFLLLTASFMGIMFATLLPAVTAFYVRDELERVRAWHARMMTYSGMVSFLALHGMVLIGRPVIIACLGPAFAPVFPAAVILSLAMAPLLLSYAGMNLSILEKRSATFLASVIAGLVVMVVTAVWLVPRLGAVGAAWSSLGGYLTLAAGLGATHRRWFGAIVKPLARVTAAGAVFFPLYFLRLPPAWSAVILLCSSALYLGGLVTLGWVDMADATRLLEAFKRSRPTQRA